MKSFTMQPKFQDTVGGAKILNSGHDIPRIGLGISRITTQDDVDSSINTALGSGYRLFDTAHIYENEKELGEALQKFLVANNLTREEIFITTKVPIKNDDTAESVERIVKESLTKLQTDYLDLVLVHYPRDRDTGTDEEVEINKANRKITYQKLEEINERGVIRSIGVSNYEVYHLVELLQYAKIVPAVNQVEYTPYCTKPILKYFCEENGIFLQAFSSLCWGNKEVLAEEPIKNAAFKYNVTPQHILYAFAVNTNVGIIPKSATPTRIFENLNVVAKVKLTAEEITAIAELDSNRAFCPRCYPWRCL